MAAVTPAEHTQKLPGLSGLPGSNGTIDHDQLDWVRATNRARILALADELGTVSCPTLADRSGLSRQTVYLITAELERAGVLVDDGVGRSSGGRRPHLLRYEPRSWGAIGVEMREREASAVLTDLSGAVMHRLAVPLFGTSPAQVTDAVQAVAEQLVNMMPAGRVLGTGVALPGLIDVERGVVRMSVPYDWSEVPLAALLRERTSLPAFVASRPAAAALGEARAGAGRGARRLVYLFAGSSLGIGLAFDGELYQGISSSAGEFGHITIEPDGPRCACGNRGCLNALASGNALLAQARASIAARPVTCAGPLEWHGHDLDSLGAGDLAALAVDGDPLARSLIQDAGRHIGIAAAGVINLLNPDHFLVGGSMSVAGDLLLDAIRHEASQRALAAPYREVHFGFGALGPASSMVGAAALVLRAAPLLLGRG